MSNYVGSTTRWCWCCQQERPRDHGAYVLGANGTKRWRCDVCAGRRLAQLQKNGKEKR